MRLDLAVALPNEARSVPVVRHIVRAVMSNLGVAARCVHDIEVALSEACTNVLQHAGPADKYDVRLHVNDERCVLRVVDVGQGGGDSRGPELPVDPPAATVEHGRGLLLIRALVDRVGFIRLAEQGTVMSLEKRLVYDEP